MVRASYSGSREHGCGDKSSQRLELNHLISPLHQKKSTASGSSMEMEQRSTDQRYNFLTSFNLARGRARRTIIRPTRSPQGELSFVKPNLMGRDRCRLTSSSMHLSIRMLVNEKLKKSVGRAPRAAVASANSRAEIGTWRTTMIGLKTLVAAALVSMTAVTSASAQLPSWAASNPGSFQAQYPDRDVLNGGALTPAGRMGLELPGGAAPVFGTNNAYAATGHATATSCAQLYHSYDSASGTFLGYDGRRHACE
jgi:hypothetical protein